MCVPGETHINDFFLYLKRQDNNEVVNQPKLLYHGMHDVVTLNKKKKTTVLISLKQMTNHIRVIAHHLDNNPDNTISIEDTNGKYGYDSQFANDDRVTYIPHYMDSLKKSDPLIADFNVMKLENSRTPHLQIMDGAGTVRYDENLIGNLLAANPSINFEYDHDFTIEISFNNYIPVNIKINGWEIINEYLPAYFIGLRIQHFSKL